ncbi:MAG: hypothetical protein GC150_17045 [Rhizobiales bacterium]|nr:hypothetical protein [Hyphomicrobiales bacterium]
MTHDIFPARTARTAVAVAIALSVAAATPALAATKWRASPAFGSVTLPDEPNGNATGSYTGSGGGSIYGRFAKAKCGGTRCPGGGYNLTGYWVEPHAGIKCDKAVHGSFYWGRIDWTFNDDYTEFKGSWSDCDGPMKHSANGRRN